jgi:hypothetical protein
LAWLNCPCGDEGTQVPGQDIGLGVGEPIFVEACQYKPGIELASELIFESVAKLQWAHLIEDQPLPVLLAQVLDVRVRNRVPNFQAVVVHALIIEEITDGVAKSSEQHAAGPQNSEAFPPHRANLRHKAVRARMEDQAKGFVSEHGKVRRIAFHNFQRQALSFGHYSILL